MARPKPSARARARGTLSGAKALLFPGMERAKHERELRKLAQVKGGPVTVVEREGEKEITTTARPQRAYAPAIIERKTKRRASKS